MSTPQEVLARFEKGGQLLAEALRGVSAEALDRSPGPGKWTIRQITVHLADSEVVGAVRIRFVAGQPNARLVPFDQEPWAANMLYPQQPVESAVAAFQALRQSTAAMLRLLPEAAWSRTGHHDERGELTLAQLVDSIASHAENHARQIQEHRARFSAVA